MEVLADFDSGVASRQRFLGRFTPAPSTAGEFRSNKSRCVRRGVVGKSSAEHRFAEEGLTGFGIPVGEAGFPIPEGPRDCVGFGEITDFADVAVAAIPVGHVDGTKLAKVDGTPEFIRPLPCHVE